MSTTGSGRWPLAAAALLLALATIAGAAGAHSLPDGWSALRLHVYDTAVRYQFYQSLGLLGMGVWLSVRAPDSGAASRRCGWAAGLLCLGIVLFSGSLYALSLGVPHWVGVVTPVGGVLMIAAWGVFAYGVWRK